MTLLVIYAATVAFDLNAVAVGGIIVALATAYVKVKMFPVDRERTVAGAAVDTAKSGNESLQVALDRWEKDYNDLRKRTEEEMNVLRARLKDMQAALDATTLDRDGWRSKATAYQQSIRDAGLALPEV